VQDAEMEKAMITMPTSARHQLLLDTAMRRATTPTRAAMLERMGRSLDTYGSLTHAMIEACTRTIMPSS
jgi:hypothetical protein